MKVLSEEHKRKLQEGRETARKLRQSSTAPEVAALPSGNGSGIHGFDWEHAPMEEARAAYGKLRKEFENAGTILNSRSMPTPGSYVCFMCQITHPGEARGKDDSQVSPITGLAERVRICGEECWISFQDFCIRTRSMRNDMAAGLIDLEEYKKRYSDLLEAMRRIRNQKMMKSA